MANSDYMADVEFDDVLSSIRRLVSDEDETQQEAPRGAGRLILTPALRVDAPAADMPPPEAGAGMGPGEASHPENDKTPSAPEEPPISQERSDRPAEARAEEMPEDAGDRHVIPLDRARRNARESARENRADASQAGQSQDLPPLHLPAEEGPESAPPAGQHAPADTPDEAVSGLSPLGEDATRMAGQDGRVKAERAGEGAYGEEASGTDGPQGEDATAGWPRAMPESGTARDLNEIPSAPREAAPVAAGSAHEGSADSLVPDEFEPDEAAADAGEAAAELAETGSAGRPLPEDANSGLEAMERAWSAELARIKALREGADGQEMARSRPNSLEARIAELEAAVNRRRDEWEPDGSEPEAARPVEHRIFDVVEHLRESQADMAPYEDETEPDATLAPREREAADLETASGPEAPGVFSEEVRFGQEEAQAEARGPRARAMDEGGQAASGIEPLTEPDDAPGDEPCDEHSDGPADAPMDAAEMSSAVPLGQKPVFSHSQPYLLGVGEKTGDESRKAEAAASDEAEEAIADKPDDGHLMPDPAARAGEIVEEDDVYLDVDALRDMITEVVRDELRGRLGETITRNVRRMVRQEIRQALIRYEDDD